jgi:hypothetical protein
LKFIASCIKLLIPAFLTLIFESRKMAVIQVNRFNHLTKEINIRRSGFLLVSFDGKLKRYCGSQSTLVGKTGFPTHKFLQGKKFTLSYVNLVFKNKSSSFFGRMRKVL